MGTAPGRRGGCAGGSRAPRRGGRGRRDAGRRPLSRPAHTRWEVRPVPAAATHDLRRRILRDGRADAVVAYAGDATPHALHLGVRAGSSALLVGVASFTREPAPPVPGRPASRLRGMAVEARWQGRGVGRALLEAGVRRLRAEGVEVLWANGRDSALDFYRHLGMQVVGEGFVEVGLPHHLVVLDLAATAMPGPPRRRHPA